jgi:hypothetical protein
MISGSANFSAIGTGLHERNVFGARGISIPLKYSVLASEAIVFVLDHYSEWTSSLQGHERGME